MDENQVLELKLFHHQIDCLLLEQDNELGLQKFQKGNHGFHLQNQLLHHHNHFSGTNS